MPHPVLKKGYCFADYDSPERRLSPEKPRGEIRDLGIRLIVAVVAAIRDESGPCRTEREPGEHFADL
jgi:hypothetical protein